MPEIKAYLAKARLRRGVEMVKLSNRIAALKMAEDEEDSSLPQNAGAAAQEAVQGSKGSESGAKRLSRAARSAIFREVVLAKVREIKENEEKEKKIAEHNA